MSHFRAHFLHGKKMLMLNHPDFLYLVPASGCATLGAVFDFKSRRIPNLLTAPAFALGLVMHAGLVGGGVDFFVFFGGLTWGFIFVIFYLAGGMGAGDVKLISSVGCLAGLPHVVYLLALTSLAGGAMAIVLAMARGRLKETFSNIGALAIHHVRRGLTPHEDLHVENSATLRLPYGLAIAAGAILTLYLVTASKGTP
jgi:prepilin peptidase CpaA